MQLEVNPLDCLYLSEAFSDQAKQRIWPMTETERFQVAHGKETLEQTKYYADSAFWYARQAIHWAYNLTRFDDSYIVNW